VGPLEGAGEPEAETVGVEDAEAEASAEAEGLGLWREPLGVEGWPQAPSKAVIVTRRASLRIGGANSNRRRPVQNAS